MHDKHVRMSPFAIRCLGGHVKPKRINSRANWPTRTASIRMRRTFDWTALFAEQVSSPPAADICCSLPERPIWKSAFKISNRKFILHNPFSAALSRDWPNCNFLFGSYLNAST